MRGCAPGPAFVPSEDSFANTAVHAVSSRLLQQSSGEQRGNLLLVAGNERLDGGKAWEVVPSALQRTQFSESLVFPA